MGMSAAQCLASRVFTAQRFFSLVPAPFALVPRVLALYGARMRTTVPCGFFVVRRQDAVFGWALYHENPQDLPFVRFDVRLLVRSSVRPCCFAAMPHALESSSVTLLFVVHYSSSFMRRVQPTQRIHQTTFSCSSPRLLFIAQTHIASLMQSDWQILFFEHAESAWF